MVSLQRLLSVVILTGLVSTSICLYYLNTISGSKRQSQHHHEVTVPQTTNSEIEPPPSSVVRGYCHFPENITVGSEGEPPTPRYKLASVLTLVRHGNRLPMDSTPPLGPLKLPTVTCVMNVTASSMPRLLTQFIAKTEVASPWTQETLHPVSVKCAAAGLTQIGVEQHIKTGQLLNQVYKDQLLLSQKNIRVISTARSRTFHSVVAFVFGLLDGDVDYPSLPVEPAYTPNFCRSTKLKECECPRAQSYLAAGEKTLRKLRDSDPFFIKFSSSVRHSVGMKYPLRPFYPWKTAHDMLISRLCRKDALPCNNKFCFRESQADLIWQSLNLYHQQMSADNDMMQAAKLEMYHFLQEIVFRLSNHSTQTSSQIQDKFTVYSGHDNTIIPLLLALGLPVQQWPPFASRLIFELYKPLGSSQSKTKEHIFKLIYNGKDVTNLLKFCVSNVGYSYEGCALKDLINYFHNLLPSIGFHDFQQACSGKFPE